MTSSGTSTEPAGSRRELLLTAALALGPAIIGGGVLYQGRLSVAALFLAVGWTSIVATGYLLYRAAMAFSLDAGALGDALEGSALSAERRHELEREKKLLLKAIKEAEFDHDMGKLDDRDAAEVTRGYRARALEIMRQLDATKGGAGGYADVVEKELAKRLVKAEAKADKADKTDKAEAAAALKPEVDSRPVELRCAQCDVKNDLDAVFCKKCGAKLS